MDIEHSLRWHDPGRFNGYFLSRHLAGTPVDAVNLRDALRAVKERVASPALGAFASMRSCLRCHRPQCATGYALGHCHPSGSKRLACIAAILDPIDSGLCVPTLDVAGVDQQHTASLGR